VKRIPVNLNTERSYEEKDILAKLLLSVNPTSAASTRPVKAVIHTPRSVDAVMADKPKVGFVGWRGMVGSVLMDRMEKEKNFDGTFEPVFFSTSAAGGKGPTVEGSSGVLGDAMDIEELKKLDVIMTAQGGDYTSEVHPKLREAGWDGYWIDAASTLRMADNSVIVLDPVNRDVIDKALQCDTKDFVGGNCTVSLLLLALAGLLKKGWVEWITSMTYQAASGAGARNMLELVKQMRELGSKAPADDAPAKSILDLDREVTEEMRSGGHPTDQFGANLAGSLIPWIDKKLENGQTKEEWKGGVEANKILGNTVVLPIDGQCVRVGSMRCHSQAVVIKLKEDVPMEEVEAAIASHNDWVKLVANEKEDTLKELSPAAATGTLDIPIGRLRKMNLGPEYLTGFTVGDQLLWGAAEPIRRMLMIALNHIDSGDRALAKS
jgi:aspartate-semialdehyde dehydrogenase